MQSTLRLLIVTSFFGGVYLGAQPPVKASRSDDSAIVKIELAVIDYVAKTQEIADTELVAIDPRYTADGSSKAGLNGTMRTRAHLDLLLSHGRRVAQTWEEFSKIAHSSEVQRQYICLSKPVACPLRALEVACSINSIYHQAGA